VVTAAGNEGATGGAVSKPGDDPFVLTVGASDVNGTATIADDTVAPFSSRGRTIDGVEKPDLVAPGTTIVATRAAGSTVDTFRPEGRVGTTHFKGTGTSQAAAIVSGVAALLFEADPFLTPDEAKAALVGTAVALSGQPGSGAGQVNAAAAIAAVRAGATEPEATTAGLVAGTGTGTLDASRGSHRVYVDSDGDGAPEALGGEVDALGRVFDALAWTNAPWTAASWKESPWAAVTCVARRWWLGPVCGASGWRGMAWDSEWWGSQTWSQAGWVQKSWTNKSWTQKSWTIGDWN
jgi:serine protease AprX